MTQSSSCIGHNQLWCNEHHGVNAATLELVMRTYRLWYVCYSLFEQVFHGVLSIRTATVSLGREPVNGALVQVRCSNGLCRIFGKATIDTLPTVRGNGCRMDHLSGFSLLFWSVSCMFRTVPDNTTRE